MCDQETKRLFKVGYIIQAAIIAVLGWGVTELIQIRDYTKWSENFHAEVPAGFFTKPRWGLDDERKSQREFNNALQVLDKRILVNEQQHLAHMTEAELWKDMIRDLVKAQTQSRSNK